MKGRVERREENLKGRVIRNSIVLLLKIIIIIVIFYFIFTSIFGIIRVQSDTMTPAVRDGDLLIYYRLDDKLHAGDVVVAEVNNKKYILRIIGVPGDFIEIKDDKILINGSPEEHIAYYKTIKDKNKKIKYPYRVKAGNYFLVNDYRSFTDDSRKFGSISRKNILGKVIGKLQTRNI